jgi:uronate dehydrogenase
MFTNENAHRLGYRPEDHASEHRAAGFRPLSAIQDTEGRGYVGGYFAVNQLPSIAGTMPEDGTPIGLTGT